MSVDPKNVCPLCQKPIDPKFDPVSDPYRPGEKVSGCSEFCHRTLETHIENLKVRGR